MSVVTSLIAGSEVVVLVLVVLLGLFVAWHTIHTRQPKGAPPTFSYLFDALSGLAHPCFLLLLVCFFSFPSPLLTYFH